MKRLWSRQVGCAIVAAAAAAALGLAGCSAGAADGSRGSGGSTAGAQEDDSGEQIDDAAIVQAPADLAGSTSLSIEAEFTAVQESDEARLLAPGVDLRITEVAQTDALSVEVVEDLGGEVQQTEDEAPVETVHAADGHVFWIARYSSDDPQWEPRGEVPDSTATLALSGNEVADVFTTSDGTMHRGTVVASLPADSGPDAGVLQVETDEKFQELSLLDGTRVASDVEHIYQVAGHQVEVTSAEEFEETFEGLTGEQRLAGSVVGGFVTPWLGRSDNGQGWAGNGQMYLSVELEWAEFESVSDDETGIYVELADGTTVRQHDPASYLSSPFRENPVFLIPADSETVTVVLEPQVTVGIEDEALTWDGPAAELSITAA